MIRDPTDSWISISAVGFDSEMSTCTGAKILDPDGDCALTQITQWPARRSRTVSSPCSSTGSLNDTQLSASSAGCEPSMVASSMRRPSLSKTVNEISPSANVPDDWLSRVIGMTIEAWPSTTSTLAFPVL